jgi:carboxyl-terminal processing protease
MSVYEGTRLLRGAPGTKVSLVVLRGSIVDPRTVEVTREVASGPDVTGRMEGATVGYLRIAAFGPGVATGVASKVAELTKAGATALLVDVRDTATGSYESGVAAAKLFVPSGTLTIKAMRGAARQPVTAAAGDGAITQPTVLLVGEGTSGAAEIFAAALAGNHRAALVGERTLGRAAVQKFIQLPDGSAMIVSNGWFLTPGGEPIHEKGLAPDVAVDVPEIDFGTPPPATDVILQKGLEKLKGK